MKTTRVTIELSPEFLRHLHVNQGLLKATREGQAMTASDILARLVYLEARGALPGIIHGETPMEWRQGDEGPRIIFDERRVYEDGKLINGPTVITSQ